MSSSIYRAVNTTLIYIECGGEYLMLHRTKKENDCNRDKWIGIGGKFEEGESPEECALRETKEETGLALTSYRYRGIVTFVSDKWESEYMHLFTADGFEGTLMDKLLVSACLLGTPCRYDGKSKADARVQALVGRYEIVPVCPEQLGGLPTPRVPSERRGERVVTAGGRDVTEAYRRGAEAALALCQQNGCEAAVLKEKSPSCGCGQIYDGTFSRRLTEGDGVTAEALKAHGITIYGESDAEKL